MCSLCFDSNEDKESEMREVPSKLEKFLSDNYKAFYKLGWIDEVNLELNSTGKEQLHKLLLEKFEDELGEKAKAEVERIEKEVQE